MSNEFKAGIPKLVMENERLKSRLALAESIIENERLWDALDYARSHGIETGGLVEEIDDFIYGVDFE